MHWIIDINVWTSLLTLSALEIVLGIDNLVMISILVGKLPPGMQNRAWQTGLTLALGARTLLLLSLGWVMRLTVPLFTLGSAGISARDLILILGGLYLIWKGATEIYDKLEGGGEKAAARQVSSFLSAIGQIVVLDIVFSLDSVITAVGMSNRIGVMIAAIVIAILLMLAFSRQISRFIEEHPTIKVLALAFLILIGVNLLAEGFHQHFPRGYTYFALAFSILVEMLNMRLRPKVAAVRSRTP